MTEATIVNFPGTRDPAVALIGAVQHLSVSESKVLVGLVAFDDFANPWEAAIWSAAVRLIDTGEQPDPVLLLQAIREVGEIAEANKLQEISKHIIYAYERCPHPRSAMRYAAAVVEDKYRREIAKHGQRLEQIADIESIDELDVTMALWLDDLRALRKRLTDTRAQSLGGAL